MLILLFASPFCKLTNLIYKYWLEHNVHNRECSLHYVAKCRFFSILLKDAIFMGIVPHGHHHHWRNSMAQVKSYQDKRISTENVIEIWINRCSNCTVSLKKVKMGCSNISSYMVVICAKLFHAAHITAIVGLDLPFCN